GGDAVLSLASRGRAGRVRRARLSARQSRGGACGGPRLPGRVRPRLRGDGAHVLRRRGRALLPAARGGPRRDLRRGARPRRERRRRRARIDDDRRADEEVVNRMKKYQLMAPGPTPVPSEVLLAMAQPMIHHRTPQYEALFVEVRAGLKKIFQTTADVIPLACSGTGAMEAAVVNTLSAGDSVAVVRAGKFADRWVEICKAYGVTVVELAAPFGLSVPAERVAETLRTHPGVKAVLTQHSESSTGVLHDVRGYAAAARGTDAILIVDAVSSLGIADLPMDAWGVDLVVSGS